MNAIQDIAYVRYQAPDLDAMERFVLDFGLQRSARTNTALFMRGCGDAHHVHITEQGASNRAIGFGLHAQKMGTLEDLSRRFNVPLELNTGPGGGHRVRVADPAGFVVDVIHGQATLPPLPHRDPIDLNTAGRRLRIGRSVRVPAAPSAVMRLGHIVLLVPEFKKSYDFYCDNFGFRASDSYFTEKPENIIASFLHCGLGTTYTDHHTIALIAAQDGIARFDHCAFEVLDLDDIMQGNSYLETKGYDSPVSVAPMSRDALKQWAPPLNPEFFS